MTLARVIIRESIKACVTNIIDYKYIIINAYINLLYSVISGVDSFFTWEECLFLNFNTGFNLFLIFKYFYEFCLV